MFPEQKKGSLLTEAIILMPEANLTLEATIEHGMERWKRHIIHYEELP